MKLLWQYAYNWGVLFSQALSVLLGGHPDDSISERTARAYLAHYNKRNWKAAMFSIMRDVIDLVIFWEKNHTMNSIKDEVNAREIWNWEE